MNSRSVAAIRYVDAAELFQWIKRGTTGAGEPFQVIDVRGSDYIGGHIVNGWNYPYRELRDGGARMEELMQRLRSAAGAAGAQPINCVFHCAQSQQRGPSAAMKFLRSVADEDLARMRVCVLRGGFNHWQAEYGEDASVTEAYVPDLWRM
ncbi:phosphatase YCH1 [Lachancea thermotolerans CBS 6340]|uniref:KLTH0B01562p n=1 Tax=Lachancea thermotolerans (strain ATCC 56472 / CBS 6340 / NRRL Y-8284) TaxID=559295 RepID=C5DCA9_LACTC|nr:KLTH0B01562p [Lachancea thermotolerans CBS 6340]CAR21420.1 KLTH0B01562p [Lachancea thermotolerans CBS 6340]